MLVITKNTSEPEFTLLKAEYEEDEVYVEVHMPWNEGSFQGDPTEVAEFFTEFAKKLSNHVADWHTGHVEAENAK